MTHFPVTALRSVELDTPDLARSEAFYTSAWGLELVTRQEGVTYLPAGGTDHHVVDSPQVDRRALKAVTFRLDSDAEFERVAATSQQHGATLLCGPMRNPGPDGGTAMPLRAPNACVLRFVHGDERHSPLPAANRP